jgi:protein-tyrosine phosphatase
MTEPIKVVFVCLGNICRSPLAEALFIHELDKEGLSHSFTIDSCGTNGFHNGEAADKRTRENASKHGIAVPSISRQLTYGDIQDFDYIITMASDVHFQVLRFCETKEEQLKIHQFRKYDPKAPNANVPDPWYGGEDGFEDVFQIIKENTDYWIQYFKNNYRL